MVRKRFREVKPETEETPDQFIIRLKNYLAKWLELPGSSSGDFEALVDLIVKKQFINACFEELTVREWTQGPGRVNYMGSAVPIAHEQQLGGKPSLQTSLNIPNKENQHNLNYIQHKDARGHYSATDAKVIATDNQKTRAMVARSNEDGE